MRVASNCNRSSVGVSINSTAPPSVSTAAPTRVRLSRGSVERQTAQPHPSCGTPKLVPVPRKVSFTLGAPPPGARSYRLDLHEVRRARYVEGNARRDDDAIALPREPVLADRLEGELDHVAVRVAVLDETGDHPPHEGELTIRALGVGQDEDGHTGAMRGDDA